ncbi:MAG: DNA translocase FtsK [Lachnospiraceae bacterium]|nr:DNA translocase FtsK [Lachnospiraceae bacterium]
MFLVPKISFIGTIILMVLILLGSVVFITEKSIVEPLERKSKKVYDTARNDLDRHRTVKKRTNEYISDNRQSSFDGRDESEHRSYYQPSINDAVNDTGSGNTSHKRLKNRQKTDKEIKSTSNGTIFFDTANRERISRVNEFVVTISDEDNGNKKPENAPSDWYVDTDSGLSGKKQKTDVHYVSDNAGQPADSHRDRTVSKKDYDTLYNNSQYEEDVYEDILATDTGRTDDIRKVVTSTGRVIEKEIDPTIDPIAEKRKAAQEAAKRQNESGLHAVSGTYGEGTDAKNAGQNGPKAAASKGQDSSASAFTMNKPVKPMKPYKKPPIGMLAKSSGKSGAMTKSELDSTALKLEQTLRDFGVGVTVTDYSCGPAVTRYELQPDHGVKVSRIVNLADDIKLNLAAADIRIEAPIPGKSAIGIEVPNTENSTVYFRNVIESNEFCNYPSNLAFAVGKDIAGNNIIADLARMPHLLIAGATGSGKSVCINTLIMSIIYKTTPEDVQLIMIDPKVVELSVYNGIPHLGGREVVTDPKLAAGALNWAVAEMTDRYKRFAEYNVRNLKGYNEKVEELKAQGEEVDKLPQIVIIVDELADLMMVSAKEVEDSICRLAQLARAAGIHLVIATQRPSVNVITGLIKANIPSRIAFAVSSGVDSRTIIDMNGAEKLLGRGDMLFYPSGYQKPVRVQGAFVSDQEVAKVVEYLRERNSVVESDRSFSEELNRHVASNKDSQNSKTSESQFDEYFEKAGRFIIEKDKASIGMLQRVFKIGFNRAGRIMDQLAEAGVVGEEEGTKPRKVLMSMEQFENFIEEYL